MKKNGKKKGRALKHTQSCWFMVAIDNKTYTTHSRAVKKKNSQKLHQLLYLEKKKNLAVQQSDRGGRFFLVLLKSGFQIKGSTNNTI